MDARRPPTEADQHVPSDINTGWLESIKNRADMSLRRKPPSKPTIFRVPPSMRCSGQAYEPKLVACSDEPKLVACSGQAYEPKLVSIGPYHRGRSMNLKAMEELKWRLLHSYLSKVPDGSNNEGLRKMKDLELRARDCYSEVIDLNSDQFVEMLLLDGCFLVQIFMASDEDSQAELSSLLSNDIAKELKSLLDENMWFGGLVFRDLLLLENQIPYFIIEHLLDTLMPGWDSSRLQKVAISSFARFLPRDSDINLDPGLHVDHLLHLFHKWIVSVPKLEKARNTRSCSNHPLEPLCSALSLMINKSRDYLSKVLPCCNNSSLSQELPLLPEHAVELPQSVPTETEPADQRQSIRTVTELVEAGVKIKVKKEKKSFLNISFSKGVLEIPAICVDDHTNFLFANLIAFEQSSCKHELEQSSSNSCLCEHELDVTHYTMFLDDIINTPRDVELLHQEGIIQRDLGSNEDIASLFNKLGNGVTYAETNYLGEVRKGLNAYCQSRWPRWRAKAVRDYFSNPWAIISLVAAVLLLGLTILQSVYAVLDYYTK